MKRARVMAGITPICAAVAMSGCGTLPDGRVWGEEATWRPGSERLRTAALERRRGARPLPTAGGGCSLTRS